MEEFQLLSDSEIAHQIRAGMAAQATLRIQARQMKALDRIADATEDIAKLLALRNIPIGGFAAGEVYNPEPIMSAVETWAGDHEPGTTLSIEPEGEGPGGSIVSVGPATDLEDAGTPRVRRRRGAAGEAG